MDDEYTIDKDKTDSEAFEQREPPPPPQIKKQLTNPPTLIASETTSPESSHTLKQRFVLEEVLGAGGMGVVYKAKDLLKEEAQDREPYIAIKVLNEEFKTHPEAFIALQRESVKTQRIAHPNIVNVYDFDRDGETVFMTMELLKGEPLDKLIRKYRNEGLPHEDIELITDGMCSALSYAHNQGIIHSDFKPGNIFVTKDSVTKVFDFGIARAVARVERAAGIEEDKTVFDAGNLGALTPAYASYEMLQGDTPDSRDDIYALGCIIYEMYTGQHPFNRLYANEAFVQKLVPARISKISSRKWKTILSALEFLREDRISTVSDFYDRYNSKPIFNIDLDLGKYNRNLDFFKLPKKQITNEAPASDFAQEQQQPPIPQEEKEKHTKGKFDQSYIYVATKHQSSESVSFEDKLNRMKLIDTLASFLAEPENSHHQTIGLLGDWGIGKSSTIELLKKSLLTKHPGQHFLFAHFSAWEYEHTNNLQAGIAQEAIKALASKPPNKSSFIKKNKSSTLSDTIYSIKDFLQSLFWVPNKVLIGILFALQSHKIRIIYTLFIILLIAYPFLFVDSYRGLLEKLLPQNLSLDTSLFLGKIVWASGFTYILHAELKKLFATPFAKEFLTYIKLPNFGKHLGTIPVMRENIRNLVKIRLENFLFRPINFKKHFWNKTPTRLLFVVDDLDRCDHTGIVKIFEAIRLVLDIENVIVLVAVDQRIALSALSLHYEKISKYHTFGNSGLIARDYLAKVIHVPIIITNPNIDEIEIYLNNIWKKTSAIKEPTKSYYIFKEDKDNDATDKDDQIPLSSDLKEKSAENDDSEKTVFRNINYNLNDEYSGTVIYTNSAKNTAQSDDQTVIHPKNQNLDTTRIRNNPRSQDAKNGDKTRIQDKTVIRPHSQHPRQNDANGVTANDYEHTNIHNNDTCYEQISANTYVSHIAGLDLHQQIAFIYWTKHFELYNPRQIKRLNNTYYILCSYFDEDLELLGEYKLSYQNKKIRIYPIMITLFSLEYLNCFEDLKKRAAILEILKGKTEFDFLDRKITNTVVNVVNRSLSDKKIHLVDAIQPFVLPSIEI